MAQTWDVDRDVLPSMANMWDTERNSLPGQQSPPPSFFNVAQGIQRLVAMADSMEDRSSCRLELCITASHPRGAADRSGMIMEGDLLVSVNDRTVQDKGIEELTSLMAGNVGSQVHLVLIRRQPRPSGTRAMGSSKVIEVSLQRALIQRNRFLVPMSSHLEGTTRSAGLKVEKSHKSPSFSGRRPNSRGGTGGTAQVERCRRMEESRGRREMPATARPTQEPSRGRHLEALAVRGVGGRHRCAAGADRDEGSHVLGDDEGSRALDETLRNLRGVAAILGDSDSANTSANTSASSISLDEALSAHRKAASHSQGEEDRGVDTTASHSRDGGTHAVVFSSRNQTSYSRRNFDMHGSGVEWEGRLSQQCFSTDRSGAGYFDPGEWHTSGSSSRGSADTSPDSFHWDRESGLNGSGSASSCAISRCGSVDEEDPGLQGMSRRHEGHAALSESPISSTSSSALFDRSHATPPLPPPRRVSSSQHQAPAEFDSDLGGPAFDQDASTSRGASPSAWPSTSSPLASPTWSSGRPPRSISPVGRPPRSVSPNMASSTVSLGKPPIPRPPSSQSSSSSSLSQMHWSLGQVFSNRPPELEGEGHDRRISAWT